MRHYFSALVLLLGLAAAPVAAHASPVTYDVVLNNVFGNTGNGSGSFTINNPPTSIANSYTTANGGLTDITFNIGHDTFDLGNLLSGYGEVDFLLGNLTNIFYVGGDSNKTVDFELKSGLLFYSFTDVYNKEFSSGYITATVDPSASAPAPEPTTLLLFGTGMLGLAALASRKLA
jgi:hypothetical protein